MTWYGDIRNITTIPGSLRLRSEFHTYSNIRKPPIINTTTVDPNKYRHHPYLALYHPSTPIIILGKQIKMKNNNSLRSIKYYQIITKTEDHMIINKCDGCNL